MILCKKHTELYNRRKEYGDICGVMGDAWCDKHNTRMSFNEEGWVEYCPYCAEEKNICQKCGEKLEEPTFKIHTHQPIDWKLPPKE